MKILLLISLLLYSGCVHKTEVVRQAKAHMIQANELHELMRSIDLVVYDKYKSELQRDNSRRRYALSLAKSIEELAHDIEVISPDELHVKSTPINKETFQSYASTLYRQSKEIKAIANTYELEKLPQSLEHLHLTCNACHTHFRDNRQ